MRTDDRRDRESDSGRKEGEGVKVVKYPGLVEDGMKENQGGSMSTSAREGLHRTPNAAEKDTEDEQYATEDGQGDGIDIGTRTPLPSSTYKSHYHERMTDDGDTEWETCSDTTTCSWI